MKYVHKLSGTTLRPDKCGTSEWRSKELNIFHGDEVSQWSKNGEAFYVLPMTDSCDRMTDLETTTYEKCRVNASQIVNVELIINCDWSGLKSEGSPEVFVGCR